MTLAQSSTIPANAPSATTAIGVRIAISPSEYLVTHAPTSQHHAGRRPSSESCTAASSRPRGYPSWLHGRDELRSGEDYVVEFLGYRFGFNATDFEERITALPCGSA